MEITYALEMFSCLNCGTWPVYRLMILPEHRLKKTKLYPSTCPKCRIGLDGLKWQKVYPANAEGMVLA